jgi:hypothetical protein
MVKQKISQLPQCLSKDKLHVVMMLSSMAGQHAGKILGGTVAEIVILGLQHSILHSHIFLVFNKNPYFTEISSCANANFKKAKK